MIGYLVVSEQAYDRSIPVVLHHGSGRLLPLQQQTDAGQDNNLRSRVPDLPFWQASVSAAGVVMSPRSSTTR